MSLDAVMPFASIARSVPSLFTEAGVFAKIILTLLFVISVISWAIIVDRTRLFLRLRAKGNALRAAISKSGFAECMTSVKNYSPSPEAAILGEAKRYVDAHARGGADRIVADSPAMEDTERSKLRDVLERRALNEIGEMERHLIFLSTTSSVAPFLGLIGTVWGIMSSFLSMGAAGTASLEVVGPGIAEALITTIAGIGSAIPALVGYNLLVRNVHRKETHIDLFISRVIEFAIVSSGERKPNNNPERERSGASV